LQPHVSPLRAFVRATVALALTLVISFRVSASAQSQDSNPKDQQSDIDAVKAENLALRELLRKVEAQQEMLLEQVDRLQRRLDGGVATDLSIVGRPDERPAGTPFQPALAAAAPNDDDRYRDGIVIWQTPETARVPFLLNFNINTQLRYLNTLSSDEAFTDHLGVVREVHRRNDITVNRAMFILGGFIFDTRLRYSFTVWTSAGAASIVVASNVGWRFSKAFSLTAGYTGVPGSRSLVNTFPFFGAIDRSMADNFFRPGFTQGAWANGEAVKGLNYLVFVGNGLNTLSISAAKIDTNLLASGSVWWEPLGPYGEPGKARNMYDDYFSSEKTVFQISINRVPRTRRCTTPTACSPSRRARLRPASPSTMPRTRCGRSTAVSSGTGLPSMRNISCDGSTTSQPTDRCRSHRRTTTGSR
jgi:hypothetical protein